MTSQVSPTPPPRRPPSALAASVIIARLAGKRLRRGKMLRVSLVLAAVLLLLPLMAGERGEAAGNRWEDYYIIAQLPLLAVLSALYMAGVLAEEIEDKTFTYLWSRPFPRWSVLLGKLMALLPVLMAITCGSTAGMFVIAFGAYAGEYLHVLVGGVIAMALGAVAASATCVGLGSLVPRHSTVISALYLLVVDLVTVGNLPFAISKLAITHHMREIAFLARAGTAELASHVGWLFGLSALWLAIAFWRTSVTELATDK